VEQYSALLSVVFMIAFVLLFDRIHQERLSARFCSVDLLGEQDMTRILRILAACQDD
jgi:hypothetical protein